MRARARAKNLQRMYKNVILSSVSSFIHLSPLSNLCLVGSLMLPVRISITRVFVTMPSQKTPSGMIASPTQPNNPPPPFSFIVFFFFFSLTAEMRWGGSDGRGEARSAASAPGHLWRTPEQLDHLAIIKGWWGGGEFVASEFARPELWLSAYLTIWRNQRLSQEVETQKLLIKSRTDLEGAPWFPAGGDLHLYRSP